MMDRSNFWCIWDQGLRKLPYMASVRGDEKIIFYLIFGRPGISEVSSSAEPDRWGAVEGRRHFVEILKIFDKFKKIFYILRNFKGFWEIFNNSRVFWEPRASIWLGFLLKIIEIYWKLLKFIEFYWFSSIQKCSARGPRTLLAAAEAISHQTCRPGNRLFRPAPMGGILDGPRTLEPGRRDLGANPRDLGGFSRNSEK